MMYKVEDADRIAAAEYQCRGWSVCESAFRSGSKDNDDLVQAFAKHRLQALGEVK